MKPLVLFSIILFLFAACADEKAEMLKKIKDTETAIFEKSQNLGPGEVMSPEDDQALIDVLLDFYRAFPEDEHAPECLDKVHMKYTGLADFKNAAAYGDTLLTNYKNYVNRAMILESLANIYDMNVSPRDTSKVRFYNELLLSENPDMTAEKAEDIRYRLDNIELSIVELIQKRITEQ
ncbi:MAG: hypothetical protein MK105_10455 [Crocinitomicaceae bacterium]|nr:hypothetical protein [Crocinitomicaceae bacterium]